MNQVELALAVPPFRVAGRHFADARQDSEAGGGESGVRISIEGD